MRNACYTQYLEVNYQPSCFAGRAEKHLRWFDRSLDDIKTSTLSMMCSLEQFLTQMERYNGVEDALKGIDPCEPLFTSKWSSNMFQYVHPQKNTIYSCLPFYFNVNGYVSAPAIKMIFLLPIE